MPCYQINQFTIENFNLKSIDILEKTLKQLGFRVEITSKNKIYARIYIGSRFSDFYFDLKNEKVEYPKNDIETFKQIKQQYSKEVVLMAAKKKNWMVKQLSENKYKASKF